MRRNIENLDSLPLEVYDVDVVKKAIVVYSSRSDSSKHLALVGTFLAAVQAQFIFITYQSNLNPTEKAINALFFLGQILDIFGTYYGLKEYNLYHWYIHLLDNLLAKMTESAVELEKIAKLVHELQDEDLMKHDHDGGNTLPKMDSDLMAELKGLYECEPIQRIVREYDRLRLLLTHSNVDEISSSEILRCIVRNPIRIFRRPWTTITAIYLVLLGKPFSGFRFSPIHWGIDCFIVGLVIFLITAQPFPVWFPSVLIIGLLVVHQEFLPRFNRGMLSSEMERAERENLPIKSYEKYIYDTADFHLFSPHRDDLRRVSSERNTISA